MTLPFNVLGTVPVLLLLATHSGRLAWQLSRPADATAWAALACFALGLTLMVATIRRFDREGAGTLAPWSPTQRLVVSGPYRYVRNPMISGVLFNLLGEVLLFRSPALLLWFALFFVGNAIYIPLAEERGLGLRFGEDWQRYKRSVPRWLPRLTPYQPSQD